jgi:hypothetical protein
MNAFDRPNVDPLWLKIEPMAVGLTSFMPLHRLTLRALQGFLLPGEEKTLQLTIFVSHSIAAPLNLRTQNLCTLLIVHTLFGQDLFLSLDGEYGTAAPFFPWVNRKYNDNF